MQLGKEAVWSEGRCSKHRHQALLLLSSSSLEEEQKKKKKENSLENKEPSADVCLRLELCGDACWGDEWGLSLSVMLSWIMGSC